VSAVDRVAAALARAGVDAEIREYPAGARTAQDAAAAVGCEVGQSASHWSSASATTRCS
jgi:hypothetical protein